MKIGSPIYLGLFLWNMAFFRAVKIGFRILSFGAATIFEKHTVLLISWPQELKTWGARRYQGAPEKKVRGHKEIQSQPGSHINRKLR